MEKRFAAAQVRANARTLFGLAAVFDKPVPFAGRREVVRQGAFSRTLASGSDVLALADHDPSRLLGRTSSGSLRLKESREGLHFDLTLPATTLANDVLALVESRNVGGMSFGFVTRRDSVAGDLRELLDLDLVEISVVSAFPAYPQTSVGARAAECMTVARARLILRSA